MARTLPLNRSPPPALFVNPFPPLFLFVSVSHTFPGIVVVLEAAATAEANQVLLTKYGIFRDRSGDLVAGPSD